MSLELASYMFTVRGKPVYGRDLSEHRAISSLGPNWVHVQVQEIDNIVVKTEDFARNLKI